MSAKIVIVSGLAAGAELWIEEMVSRIGSDPHCQLCVADAGLPAHAATLEFRSGAYLLHNRGEQPVLLAGREVPARGSTRWSAGQMLQMTETLALRLDVSGDPAPSPRPASSGAALEEPPPEEIGPLDLGATAEPPQQTGRQAVKTLAPLAIIVLCVLVGGLMLVADSSSEEEVPTRKVHEEFDALIKELDQKELLPGLDRDELRSALQAARIAELRGSKREALHYYGYLRSLVLPRRSPDGTFSSEVEKKAWNFVEGQLRSLSSSEEQA